MQIVGHRLRTTESESGGGIQKYFFINSSGVYLRGKKKISSQIFPAPALPTWSSESGLGLSIRFAQPSSPGLSYLWSGSKTPLPLRPEPRPWWGGRVGAAKARPHAGPGQSSAAVSDVALRAAPSRPRGGGTGSRLGLRALGSVARAPQVARPGGRPGGGAQRPSPGPPCRVLPGTRAIHCRVGRLPP